MVFIDLLIFFWPFISECSRFPFAAFAICVTLRSSRIKSVSMKWICMQLNAHELMDTKILDFTLQSKNWRDMTRMEDICEELSMFHCLTSFVKTKLVSVRFRLKYVDRPTRKDPIDDFVNKKSNKKKRLSLRDKAGFPSPSKAVGEQCLTMFFTELSSLTVRHAHTCSWLLLASKTCFSFQNLRNAISEVRQERTAIGMALSDKGCVSEQQDPLLT